MASLEKLEKYPVLNNIVFHQRTNIHSFSISEREQELLCDSTPSSTSVGTDGAVKRMRNRTRTVVFMLTYH